MIDERKYRLFVIFLFFLLVLSFFVSFSIGRFSKLDLYQIPKILLGGIFPPDEKTWSLVDEGVILNLRLPRIIAAIVVGASLAVSGASYQALFSNPVASSDTLGVTSGAAFGAVLGILLGFGTIWVKIISFVIGCFIVLGVYSIANRLSRGRNFTIFLILVGMVVSSMFQAFLSILKYVADPVDELPKITYWLMGSFSNVQLRDIPFCLLFFAIGMVPLFLLRWRMNLLSLSEYEAKSLGENIMRLRIIIVISATLLSASAVAMTGGISWVGLVVPHMVRFIVGNDSRKIIPASALLGSVFLLWMDNMARGISVYELPISVLTALVGAPLFFGILLKNRGQIGHGD